MKIINCEFPDDLLYDVEYNIWAREENGNLKIGINSILAWLSGIFNSVNFKYMEGRVERGKGIGSIEGVRHFDIVRAPIKCEILEFNERLKELPRLLNKDPYGDGWFAVIRPLSNEELKSYLKGLDEAREQIAQKILELRVHCFSEYPDHEMFEIGVECSAVLVRLNELISSSKIGTVIHIVSDDPTAPVEMERWSIETGQKVIEDRKEGNIYHFIVKKVI